MLSHFGYRFIPADPRAVQGTGNAAHGTGSAAPSNKEAGPGHAKGAEPAPRLRRCTSARRVLSGGPTLRQKIQGRYLSDE